MIRIRLRSLSLLGIALLAGGTTPSAFAQDRTPRPTQVPGAPPATPMPARPMPPANPKKLKEYAEVVTKEAKTDKGVFTVHRIEDRVLFEIPKAMLGRDMLWQVELAQTPAGRGAFNGAHVRDRVVRWTRRNNQIFLLDVSYNIRAVGDPKSPLARAVADSNVLPILLALNVETENADKDPVIDATGLFARPSMELGIPPQFGGVDPSRSYLDRIKAFPQNIETRYFYTFAGPTSASALAHYSLNLLPEKPMQGRLADSRVGYFTEDFQDIGSAENRVRDRSYIARYRLEKKNPNEAISEPVKPIVYYISREVPNEWRPAIKKGVEAWSSAFEQAGFKNAIQCLDAPSVEKDPDWDPEDSRYSVIRWAPNAVMNAMGPHVHDPRSGEIVSAHIIVWHDILKLQELWYFVQVAPLDSRAQRFPIPNDLQSELLQYVITHEVGHTVGLMHNHRATSTYTIAQLRNKDFTEKYGIEASIMDYGRFNYVAQPGDNAKLISILGPYDHFAIEWGYKPFPNRNSADAEKSDLDLIAARQITDPTVRFGNREGGPFPPDDPGIQTEDLSNDGIEASRLGLKNLERVAAMLLPATTKFGEGYERLGETYGFMMGQFQDESIHVVNIIGGVTETDYHAGRGGDVYRPVPRARQQQAMRYLQNNVFRMPKALVPSAVITRIGASGVANRVLGVQQATLAFLLFPVRIQRMVDAQALLGKDAYSVTEMVTDLQKGLWSELANPNPVIDIYRRNLQRNYLQRIKPLVDVQTSTASEMRMALRGALADLIVTINRVLPTTTDRETNLHLRDSRAMVDNLLNPK